MFNSVVSLRSAAPSAAALAAERILSPVDIARGWLTGSSSFPARAARPDRRQNGPSPLQALEHIVLPALLRPPCLVEFSGGRDSSLILAVATRVAAREGLPSPVAFTQHYPGLAEANEDEWQELVISHLGVSDWVRHPGLDDADLLGDMAQRSLKQWGLVWPPAAHTRATELELARGGSLLSGEGGDEVLSPRRLGVLRQLAGRHLPATKASLKQLAVALAPSRLRAARYRPQVEAAVGAHWLTPEVRRQFLTELTEDHAAEPMDWRTAVVRHPHHRGIRVGAHTFASMASDQDVQRIDPLLRPEFLSALTASVGPTGVIGRTSAMRQFFGDLLPEPVLARTSKAQFNRAFFGHQTRAFVAQWTGAGVDRTLVDADRLRLEWDAPSPHALTHLLVQSCWVAANG